MTAYITLKDKILDDKSYNLSNEDFELVKKYLESLSGQDLEDEIDFFITNYDGKIFYSLFREKYIKVIKDINEKNKPQSQFSGVEWHFHKPKVNDVINRFANPFILTEDEIESINDVFKSTKSKDIPQEIENFRNCLHFDAFLKNNSGLERIISKYSNQI